MRDETAPSQDQVDVFVEYVDLLLDQRRAVLVHCGGGYGRTGTMLVCFLVNQGWEADDAIAEVRYRRPGSIASEVQHACVVEYAQRPQRGGRL